MNAALRCHTHLVRSRLRIAHLQREATTFLLRNAPLAALARAVQMGVAGIRRGPYLDRGSEAPSRQRALAALTVMVCRGPINNLRLR
jgi:hypothetical protein